MLNQNILGKLLIIFAHKPRYKISTDWAKNCGQKRSNNKKSTTLFKKSNVAWMELICYGQLNSQSVWCGAWKEVSGAVRCVRRPRRQFSAPLEMAPITVLNAFLITVLTTYKSGVMKNILYSMFNHFQLVWCTFKFRLRITHQKILMPHNFGVAIYIVCKLICM